MELEVFSEAVGLALAIVQIVKVAKDFVEAYESAPQTLLDILDTLFDVERSVKTLLFRWKTERRVNYPEKTYRTFFGSSANDQVEERARYINSTSTDITIRHFRWHANHLPTRIRITWSGEALLRDVQLVESRIVSLTTCTNDIWEALHNSPPSPCGVRKAGIALKQTQRLDRVLNQLHDQPFVKGLVTGHHGEFWTLILKKDNEDLLVEDLPGAIIQPIRLFDQHGKTFEIPTPVYGKLRFLFPSTARAMRTMIPPLTKLLYQQDSTTAG